MKNGVTDDAPGGEWLLYLINFGNCRSKKFLRMMSKFMQWVPESWIKGIGRFVFKKSFTRPFSKFVLQIFKGTHTMSHGIGKGLKFDSGGERIAYVLGTAEPEQQNVMSQFLRQGDVFYDIGANKGFFTVLAARLVGDKGVVYAFEPFPESCKLIEKM